MLLDAWQPATIKKAQIIGAHCNAYKHALVRLAVAACLPEEPMREHNETFVGLK
jgi:hypothetical protein